MSDTQSPMTWDELVAENKALKETLDTTTDLVVDYQERLEVAQRSRDELLAFLNQARGIIGKHLSKNVWFDDFWWNELDDIIQKAQALKEEESK